MRFPLAALFLVCAGFIFLAFFGVGSMLLDEFDDALSDGQTSLDARFTDTVTLLKSAFGYIGAIFLIVGVILVFVLDALSDEPEMFYRER